MSEKRLRQVAIAGLVVAAASMTAIGLHHIRCTSTVVFAPGDAGSDEAPIPCVETYPSELVPAFMAIGLLATSATLWASWRLSASGQKLEGGRFTLGLAAAMLLVPTVLPLLGWASIGFDVGFQQDQPNGDRYCTGRPSGLPPLWLQAITCVEPLEAIAVPSVALAGILAAVAAVRASRKILFVSLALAGLVLGLFAIGTWFRIAELTTSSLVPFLGILLAVLSIPLLRSPASTQEATT